MAFIVALGMLVFFAVAPYLGLQAAPGPLVVTGFGALFGYVFAHNQREAEKEKEHHEDQTG